MKILFWVLAILSIPVGFYMSVIGYFSHGLDLAFTIVGDIVCIAGMLSVIVSIVCMVLGVIRLRKGDVKKAVAFALAGLVYSGIILAGMYADEAVDTILTEKRIAARNDQMYGEDWNAAPAIEGIPKLYQEELNKYYVAVRDCWGADELMDLGAVAMAEHYGDASLDQIGFALMDVNGNGANELLIGTVAPVEEGGTAIFCVFSDPENPFMSPCSTEGEIYYLHAGEETGTCLAEIAGADAAWLLMAEEGEGIVGISYQEGALDPADRLTLEMIPFSQYK